MQSAAQLSNAAVVSSGRVSRPPAGPLARWSAVALAGAVAGVHLSGLSARMSQTPYLGVAYIVVIAAAAWSGVAIARGRAAGWWSALVLCAGTMCAYLASRTTGLPLAHDDVGNWSSLAGSVALAVEGALIVLCCYVLSRRS